MTADDTAPGAGSLRDSERRFDATFEQAAVGMAQVAPDGRWLRVNRKLCEIVGYSRDELLALTFQDITHPDDLDIDLSLVRQVLAGEIGNYSLEERYLKKDGSVVWINLTVALVRKPDRSPDYFISVIEDIQQRKESERALAENAERYRSVIETSLDGYWVVDTTGHLVEVNNAYCRLSGYTREELLDLSIRDIDVAQSDQDVSATIERVMRERSTIFETVHRRKDGEIWDVEVAISYAPIEGGRFFCFFRDITARKREQTMAALREKLAALPDDSDQDTLMRTALDIAEAATSSEIGYFHFVDPDQDAVSLQVWSTRTLSEMCFAEGANLHYPISQGGVWVDCVRERRAVIHNDYASLPHRQGLPEGHAPVIRELAIPVMRGELIVAIIGVGNKKTLYAQRDVEMVGALGSVAYDFVERRWAAQRIQFMAYYDVLTELPNRTLLADRLQQAMAQARRSGMLIGICYLDLDGFKPVNDRHGHDVGDKLLVALADKVRGGLREGDSLARMGGDEFVILLNGLTSLHECENVVERILTTIKTPVEIDSHRFHLSASIGITLFPTDNADADTLLRHADQAMYEAKAAGKAKHRFYDPVKDHHSLAQRRLLDEFEAAIHNDQLMLYYQPKVSLRDGSVTGMEALIRWNHPQRGMLYPGDFLRAIEGTPLELALGEWVVRHALDQHMVWVSKGVPLSISINISPRQMQMLEFADFLGGVLADYPRSVADSLEIEMLEVAAVGDMENATAVMKACAELGVRFSLDDFGTGYSSLTYFHQLPIDIVKIDQRFVRGMFSNERDLDIVEGILRLADALNRPVVAEGVESIEIGMMLASLGCEFAQGYGIARPMPADLVPSWLDRWQRGNGWSGLTAGITLDRAHFVIEVAIFSHERWFDELQRYVHNELGASAPVLDDSKCQLAHWYLGVGRARYGDRPGYPFFQNVHHAVHEGAKRIVELVLSGERERAVQALGELRKRSDELTALLKKLATQ